MNRLNPRSLCQIYLLLVLLAAAMMSALSYLPLALALLLAMLFAALRPLPAGLRVMSSMAAVLLVPLLLEPILQYLVLLPLTAAQAMSALASLPAIYLLDYDLRQNTRILPPPTAGRTTGRHPTSTLTAAATATAAILLASFIAGNRTLLFTGGLLGLYLLGILVHGLLSIPGSPLDIPAIRRRVIAGDTLEITTDVTSRASTGIYGLITPADPWVRVKPGSFTLHRDKLKLKLILTPPLAGPSRPRLEAAVLDKRGFLQVNQIIESVELHVIPRARYAAWLARKYLGQAGADSAGAATLSPRAAAMLKRGIDYLDSRAYQPGDQPSDIDWKHTLKLSRLIIKEYIEAGERAAIIAVNLAVADSEEADKLAFNLITSALTLAREGIPAALAAYDHQRVVLTTPVTDPREVLKRTLSLIKDIVLVKPTARCLQPVDTGRLRRNISQLRQVKSEPAQRLLGVLEFEQRAMEAAAREHPATIALSLVTHGAPAPALILLVSELNHDAEAVLVTTEKLSRRDFATVSVAAQA